MSRVFYLFFAEEADSWFLFFFFFKLNNDYENFVLGIHGIEIDGIGLLFLSLMSKYSFREKYCELELDFI